LAKTSEFEGARGFPNKNSPERATSEDDIKIGRGRAKSKENYWEFNPWSSYLPSR
jgi:hypothetical protein